MPTQLLPAVQLNLLLLAQVLNCLLLALKDAVIKTSVIGDRSNSYDVLGYLYNCVATSDTTVDYIRLDYILDYILLFAFIYVGHVVLDSPTHRELSLVQNLSPDTAAYLHKTL